MRMTPPTRRRGQWYADHSFVGERIPCGFLRFTNFKTSTYECKVREPEGTPPGQRWLDWIERLKQVRKVIIVPDHETDHFTADGFPVTECDGYHSAWNIEDVSFDGRVLRFKLVYPRICSF
jgi:hypothetical protein